MSNNLITMSCLGRMGRWGNQAFQYIFLRTYAQRYGLDYQCPRWIGQQLFGHEDPPITVNLPTYHERREQSMHPGSLNEAYPPEGDEARGHDFLGYAQPHTRYFRPDKKFIQDLFWLSPGTWFKRRGGTVIGLHMRRGDTGRLIFYLTPNEWYLRWLEENWSRFKDPVLFIASEDPDDAKDFAQYNPVTSADLLRLDAKPYGIYNYLQPDLSDPTPTKMDWFHDWCILTQCNVMAIGKSSFGSTAAMMQRVLHEC